MKLNWENIGIITFLISVWIDLGSGLECYACENQDTNTDKCIKTTIQCEKHHERCITTVAWGLPPYWTPYGERYHYVWKGCDTINSCQAKQEEMKPFCKRDWYDDWACVECCSGDLCNYYVTLGASSVKTSVGTVLASLLLFLILRTR